MLVGVVNKVSGSGGCAVPPSQLLLLFLIRFSGFKMKRETLHNRRVICCDSVRRATPSIAVTRCKLTTKTKITPGSPAKHFLSQIDNTPSLCNENGPAEREGRDVVGKEMDATICRGTYLEINLHPPNFAIRARGAGNQSLFSFPSSFHH